VGRGGRDADRRGGRGVFTDFAGRRTAFGGSAIATNAALADAAREAMGAAGAGEGA
jgi:hypothetical protein